MGYPEKEELLEILKENFTALEAEVTLAIPAKIIPFEPVPGEKILPHINIPGDELERILSNLAKRGLLFSKKMKDGNGIRSSAIWIWFPPDLFLERCENF